MKSFKRKTRKEAQRLEIFLKKKVKEDVDRLYKMTVGMNLSVGDWAYITYDQIRNIVDAKEENGEIEFLSRDHYYEVIERVTNRILSDRGK